MVEGICNLEELEKCSKDKLIDTIKYLFENMTIDPVYKVHSKRFVIEYLRKNISIYKRYRYKYKKVKFMILLFPFDTNLLDYLKKNLRSSDIIAKYDNSIVAILIGVEKVDAFKIRKRLNDKFYTAGELIDIKPDDKLETILRKIERSISIFPKI